MPSCVRAARPAVMRGFSASTSIRAISLTDPESALGNRGREIAGTCGAPSIRAFWSLASSTTSTGAIGGVVATRYARTADRPSSSSESGWWSHLMKSRTSAAKSVALWAGTGPS